jgi:hypothetical protein
MTLDKKDITQALCQHWQINLAHVCRKQATWLVTHPTAVTVVNTDTSENSWQALLKNNCPTMSDQQENKYLRANHWSAQLRFLLDGQAGISLTHSQDAKVHTRVQTIGNTLVIDSYIQ